MSLNELNQALHEKKRQWQEQEFNRGKNDGMPCPIEFSLILKNAGELDASKI